jgi:hypothetical protein
MKRRGNVPPGWEENPTAWLAALQYLRDVRSKGGSTWGVLWGKVDPHN